MLAGLPVAILLLAAPASAAPAATTPAATNDAQSNSTSRCPSPLVNAQPGEIIVCAKRPEGYRLDPDVLAAARAKRNGGRPRRPERMVDRSCAVVGPAGCIGANPGINVIGAALTAIEMASRLAKGQEIGSMFVTDPQMSDYQLYQEAKRTREAREAEAAAVKAAKAKAAGQVHGKAVVEGSQPPATQGGPAQ
ncbi:MAG: hypothetical protein ABIS66_05945 [Sphingomicrobium sp.]